MIEKGTEQQSATSMDLASPQLELFALITPPASPCQQNTSDPNSLGKKRLPGQPRPVLEGIILLLLPRRACSWQQIRSKKAPLPHLSLNAPHPT